MPDSSLRVGMILPPDFQAPESHRRHRFPRQGPALVAASIAEDGFVTSAQDLDLDTWRRPLASDVSALADDERMTRHLRGEEQQAIAEVADELVRRIDPTEIDLFAISIDRHTQIDLSILLGVELKRRFGKRVIVGGGNSTESRDRLVSLGVTGVDIVTSASTPHAIRAAFRALREMPEGAFEIAHDPVTSSMPTPPDDWPIPDYSIYDLANYRRDPFLDEGERYPNYNGELGPTLFLPYHFAFDCQYRCSFCQRGGVQTSKSVARAVADLAELSERYETRNFMLFDAQINLVAEDFSLELERARLGLRWSDSFRVAPLRPAHVLETMARAGCMGLSIGVESGSDRMLKRMIKGHRAHQASAVVRQAHSLGMFVRANMLPCFPGETAEDARASIEWTEDNAFAIDDVAASSFYLAPGSPVGMDPERYGISIRETRELRGIFKFRKNISSLTYDEIDGYSWEEREPMLRTSETDVRDAWRRGRRHIGATIAQPSMQYALMQATGSKVGAYERYREITRGEGAARREAPMANLLSGPPPAAEDGPANAAHASVASSELEAWRAALLEAIPGSEPSVEALSGMDDGGDGRVSFAIRSADATLTAHVAPADAVDRYFRRTDAWAFWYSDGHESAPGALGALLERAASALLDSAPSRSAPAEARG